MEIKKQNTRNITEIIIHCSATPEGRDVSVDEISRWHRQRKFNEIGYHYVIYRDGTIVEGRHISKVGAHCRGHNTVSIGICYVGGCDRFNQPKDTRTPAQREALKLLTQALLEHYPYATIHGHREFAAKACPSFDVKAELDSSRRRWLE